MDIATISDLVVNLGFPITIVIAMGFFIWQLYKQSVKREEKLMEVNTEAIATIGKYADKLNVIEDDVKIIKDNINVLVSR